MAKPLIKKENFFLITDIPGYSPNISRLVCMMNYTRLTTLHYVKDLSIKQLDFLFDDKSNSIGALLLHIASTDLYYEKLTFENRELTNQELTKWKAPSELGELGRKKIKGHSVKYYFNILNSIRNNIYELFKTKDDVWLEKKIPFVENFESNYFHTWFHVIEDEINHRGQINWLRKRLPK